LEAAGPQAIAAIKGSTGIDDDDEWEGRKPHRISLQMPKVRPTSMGIRTAIKALGLP